MYQPRLLPNPLCAEGQGRHWKSPERTGCPEGDQQQVTASSSTRSRSGTKSQPYLSTAPSPEAAVGHGPSITDDPVVRVSPPRNVTQRSLCPRSLSRPPLPYMNRLMYKSPSPLPPRARPDLHRRLLRDRNRATLTNKGGRHRHAPSAIKRAADVAHVVHVDPNVATSVIVGGGTGATASVGTMPPGDGGTTGATSTVGPVSEGTTVVEAPPLTRTASSASLW